ncbi:hypothetical protein Q9247_09735 [Halomonas meridiana]|uniref:hypothetical protein n=1 Tax=Vreelandella aquamarina TaxID=77097 RepID=UPI00273B2FB7|nr:hypothetical protein [Halomonas meridiana]MDP4557963.1 hypothetical protein [Halomonas meridiana]
MTTMLTIISTAFLSSYLTALFAAKRYRDERLWDRKATAYSSVVNALRKSIRYAECYLDETRGHLIDEVGHSEQKLNEAQTAREEVENIFDIQFIFLCEEAREKLEYFLYNDSHLHGDFGGEELAEADIEKHEKLIRELMTITKSDLSMMPISLKKLKHYVGIK